MWIANDWKDYQIIDCSEGEKLERWGNYILLRPDPQVLWNTPKKGSCMEQIKRSLSQKQQRWWRVGIHGFAGAVEYTI